MVKKIYIPFTQIRMGRFLFLLISMVLTFILRPFLEAFVGFSLLMDIFVTAILISGIYALSEKRNTFVISIVFVVVVVALRGVNQILSLPSLSLIGNMISALFLMYTTVIIIIYIFREKDITSDVILGGICIYLLMGFIWALAFTILESVQAGSFQLPEGFDTGLSSFSYYSFVTITTLGYGDVTPVSPPARSLSLLEALSGQLYIAILIARLVGTHIAQSLKK